MPDAEELQRAYNLEDLDMLLNAQLFHDNFITDSVALIAATASSHFFLRSQFATAKIPIPMRLSET